MKKLFAASAGYILIQGLLVTSTLASNLKVSRISVVNTAIFTFPEDENQNRKLKYPSIENMHLSFLSIDEKDEGKETAIYTVNLANIMALRTPWFHKPSIISDQATKASFSGSTNKKHIAGIFRGELLQQSQQPGPYMLKRLRSKEVFLEQDLLVRDFKPVSTINKQNKYLMANEKGLWEGGKRLIRCQKLMNFDDTLSTKKTRLALLDYYNKKNIPLIDLVDISNHKDCDMPPIWSAGGILPSFSPDGKFLALILQTRKGGGVTWQLQIYNLSAVIKNSSSKPILTVDDVAIYDVRTEIFKFQQSYSWVKDEGKEVLYFKGTRPDQSRDINRIVCDRDTCRVSSPLQADNTFCMPMPETVKTSGYDAQKEDGDHVTPKEWEGIIWPPSTNCNKSKVTKSELDRIVWFRPFKRKGTINFAAQVVLKHHIRNYLGDEVGITPWLTRIVVLSP